MTPSTRAWGLVSGPRPSSALDSSLFTARSLGEKTLELDCERDFLGDLVLPGRSSLEWMPSECSIILRVLHATAADMSTLCGRERFHNSGKKAFWEDGDLRLKGNADVVPRAQGPGRLRKIVTCIESNLLFPIPKRQPRFPLGHPHALAGPS